jgi:hypothetical protein
MLVGVVERMEEGLEHRGLERKELVGRVEGV